MPKKSSLHACEQLESLAKVVVSMDPDRCRVWANHERLADQITVESCRSEVESYSQHGQLIPALGRSLKDDPDYDVELIYGARRLFVARHLGVPLLVELREMTDKEAVIAMEIENHHRAQMSSYERGLCFSQWLRNKLFDSQEEISRTLNIQKSQVSRHLKLTRLPSVVLSAFRSPTEICESWGLELVDAWQDPLRQRAIARRARTISASTDRPSACEVYRTLISCSALPRRRASMLTHDEIVRSGTGDPLFRIRHQKTSIALILPSDRISEQSLEEIRHFLASRLKASAEHAAGRRKKGSTYAHQKRERQPVDAHGWSRDAVLST